MLILLIRHAQAAQQSDALYPDDVLRPLVPKGRRIQRRMSRLLVRQDIIPARVFSSPWKRAWQTARIVVEETGIGTKNRIRCEALAGPPDLKALAQEIGEVGAEETIGLVGHEPWMSALAAELLVGSSSGIRIDFSKSGVLGIEAGGIEPGEGTLRFFWTP
jgi:phosphohistidine phosphatase